MGAFKIPAFPQQRVRRIERERRDAYPYLPALRRARGLILPREFLSAAVPVEANHDVHGREAGCLLLNGGEGGDDLARLGEKRRMAGIEGMGDSEGDSVGHALL